MRKDLEVFKALILRSHLSSHISIDYVQEYGDKEVVFYRTETLSYRHYRCAVFARSGRGESWSKENDIIVSQA